MAMDTMYPGLVNIFSGAIVAFIITYLFFYFNNRIYLTEYFSGSGRGSNGLTPDVNKSIDTSGQYNYTPRRTQIEDSYNNDSEKIVSPGKGEVQMTTVETPYAKQPINELDDYEYNMIFSNESEKALSKDLRQKLMSQYPMHWTTYPPSSSQFQAGLQESFQNARQNIPDDAKPYESISGSDMAPPDTGAIEKEERRILQTYKPQFPPKNGVTYDSRDANVLIKKMYDAKGLIPEVKHKEGTNVYEIVGTRRKNETVVYEDEEAPTGTMVKAAGEGVINVPVAINELTTENRDLFYNPSSGGAKNPWQYTAWTPGLERVFAPTDPKTNWT